MRSLTQSPHFYRSPFDRAATDSYRRWRDIKLKDYPTTIKSLIVEINKFDHVTDAEQKKIIQLCRKTNMVIYAAPPLLKKEKLRTFASIFGLRNIDANPSADEDSISSITVKTGHHAANSLYRDYIPYTDQPLAWHTDGYYNLSHRPVRGMILHCVTQSIAGGTSTVLDPDILYIRLRDEAPEAVDVLSRPNAMLIPANGKTRPAQAGPVFSYDSAEKTLHMRYTHRTRSVVWHEEAFAAAMHLRTILDAEDVPYIFRYRLESGQGLLCNNVLHARTSFRDAPHQRRLLYRARFLERVTAHPRF